MFYIAVCFLFFLIFFDWFIFLEDVLNDLAFLVILLFLSTHHRKTSFSFLVDVLCSSKELRDFEKLYCFSQSDRCFPVNIVKLLRTVYRTFMEHLRWLLLGLSKCVELTLSLITNKAVFTLIDILIVYISLYINLYI